MCVFLSTAIFWWIYPFRRIPILQQGLRFDGYIDTLYRSNQNLAAVEFDREAVTPLTVISSGGTDHIGFLYPDSVPSSLKNISSETFKTA